MATLKKRLTQIYKARQCTDLNDVEYALQAVENLIRLNGWRPALTKRWCSLEKRKDHFIKPEKHG